MQSLIEANQFWTHRKYKPLFRLSLGVLLLGAGLMTGCSRADNDRLPVQPVSGQISFNGKPAAGALVVFHPKDQASGLPTPNGVADAQGNYSLSTYSAGDGAPAGEYQVTVTLRPLQQKEGEYVAGPNLLPPHLSKPATSKLEARIAEGPNSVPLKLTR